jgi:hypothetical protein
MGEMKCLEYMQEEMAKQGQPVREDNQRLLLAMARLLLTEYEIRDAAEEGTMLHEEAMKKTGKKWKREAEFK